jgi:hypothetical protein
MFYPMRAAVLHMKPGSTIITAASVNSDMPNPILLAYAITKGAIQPALRVRDRKIGKTNWRRGRDSHPRAPETQETQ